MRVLVTIWTGPYNDVAKISVPSVARDEEIATGMEILEDAVRHAGA
jgi:4-aminobutyrate aminotransferase-like enzyme